MRNLKKKEEEDKRLSLPNLFILFLFLCFSQDFQTRPGVLTRGGERVKGSEVQPGQRVEPGFNRRDRLGLYIK